MSAAPAAVVVDAAPKLTPQCDRLINQLVLLQQRDHELLTLNRALAQYSAEKQTLKDKMTSVESQLDRVEGVKAALIATMSASGQAYKRMVDEDQQARKEMSADLQKKIDGVNVFAERVSKSHATIAHENASLKEQINLLKQHKSTGEGKFEELVNARAKEVENLRERAEKEKSREPLLQEALTKCNELNDLLRVEHKEWKAKVDVYVAKFETIQQKLTDAKKSFDTAQTERDRMAHRITSMETDRSAAISRAEKARDERNAELAKVNEVEQKVMTLEAQIKKLGDLFDMLSAAAAAKTE
jgi:chromosome segregation ATPase